MKTDHPPGDGLQTWLGDYLSTLGLDGIGAGFFLLALVLYLLVGRPRARKGRRNLDGPTQSDWFDGGGDGD